MSIHAPDCDCGAFACQLRSKGVQVSNKGMVRHNGGNVGASRNDRYNGWERGTVGEDRPNGTRMPYLDKHGSSIGVKKHSEGGFDSAHKALKKARAENTSR